MRSQKAWLVVVIVSLVASHFYYTSTPSYKIKKTLSTIATHFEQESVPNALQINAKVQGILSLVTKDFILYYEQMKINFELKGKADLREKLAFVISRIHHFKSETTIHHFKISGDKSQVQVTLKGEGKIIGYEGDFSEQRDFEFSLIKKDGQWKIQKIKNIPNDNAFY